MTERCSILSLPGVCCPASGLRSVCERGGGAQKKGDLAIGPKEPRSISLVDQQVIIEV